MKTMLGCGIIVCVLAGMGRLYERRHGDRPVIRRVSNATMLHRAMASPRLAFELNEGQTDREVRFLSRGPGFQLFLTDTEAVIALAWPSTDQAERSTPFATSRKSSVGPTATFRMSLVNSSHRFRPAGRRPQRGRSNYFLGRDRARWLTD